VTVMRIPTAKTVVAVFDLDRTLTRAGTFNGFLRGYVARRPVLWPCVLPALWIGASYAAGRLDRRAAKVRLLKLFFAGAGDLSDEADAFAARTVASGLRAAAGEALERHRQAGHAVVLATACMDFLARPIARRLGIGAVVATRSPRDRYADIEGEDCYGHEKLIRVAEALPTLRKECFVIAYSDHPSDAPLLTWADVGIAVNPRAGFKRQAGRMGIEVVDWNATPAPTGERGIARNQLEESFAQ